MAKKRKDLESSLSKEIEFPWHQEKHDLQGSKEKGLSYLVMPFHAFLLKYLSTSFINV